MIDKLGAMKLSNSVDQTIPALALRSVIMALPRPVPGINATPDTQEAYSAISRVMIPRLIGPGQKTRVPQTNARLPAVPTGMLQADENVIPETVDVAIEVVRCFGPLLQQVEVEALAEVVLHLLEKDQVASVVKKRAVVAISMLAVYLEDAELNAVIQRVTSSLSTSNASSVTRRLYISIIGSMARSIPVRFGPHIQETLPFIFRALSNEELENHLEKIGDGEDLGNEFNEIRESALVALEAFLAACPQEMRQHTGETIENCLRYLKYDPNYNMQEDDDDMEVEDDEEEEEEDEFEDDDFGDDDDDDASWKVRRCAAKALYTLIATRGSGDLLDNGVLYAQAAPSLIKRVDEREENVRLEVISTIGLLVRKTGEGVQAPDWTLDDFEPENTYQIPVSRKRRRQSSSGGAYLMAAAGMTSPVLEKLPPTGPRADLARLTPSIIKVATKQLKGKTIPTKQAIVTLLDDIILSQRGGLADFFPEVIVPIMDAVKPMVTGTASTHLTSAGGSASATPGTLRVAALKLISNLTKTHSSTVLQPYLSTIVTGVSSAVNDRFYKISSEAIRTVEQLIKALTPPRSQNAGNRYRTELGKLFDVIMERSSANDADAEVRQRAIHAIGTLLSRTSSDEGSKLLPSDSRQAALDVLGERLKNETTRLATVRALDSVFIFATSPGQLDKKWLQWVCLELAGQLRKADRTLRGSSIVALKHLVLCNASKDQLDSETIQGVVSSLMPTILNNDTHLLGPALLIMAHLTPGNAELIINQDMVTAICQLLKSHFAGLVLDQLLVLVSNVGATPASNPLMTGLLREVSVSGDPSVTGKVIGTLLVKGGSSSGVSLDNFVGELQHSAKSGDDARVCLALAVLGESAKRLGTESSLKPQLFLEQFHEEPDKVSLAAALALGRAGSGNLPEFLKVILEQMQSGGNKQYLLIQSIKEILQSITAQSGELRDFAQPIWDQLLAASEHADNKVVCAECVGRLVTLDPAGFMPKLEV